MSVKRICSSHCNSKSFLLMLAALFGFIALHFVYAVFFITSRKTIVVKELTTRTTQPLATSTSTLLVMPTRIPVVAKAFTTALVTKKRPRLDQDQSMAAVVNKKLRKSPTPTKLTLDMVDDYQPFIDFKFVYPDTAPPFKHSQNLVLIILVNSGAKGDHHRWRRQNIRNTWGNRKNCELLRAMKDPKNKNLKWRLVFVVGKAGPKTDDDILNAEEAKQYNDMLIGNVEDNYLNNIIKLYMGLLWVSKFQAKYILKTDDDVYVRIPPVLDYLEKEIVVTPFYGGAVSIGAPVMRDFEGKWGISRKYFADNIYPPYSVGAFLVLSTDLLPSLFKYVNTTKPFHVDDAYVGIAMRDLKVKVTHIISFDNQSRMAKRIPRMTNCYVLTRIAFGHCVLPKLSRMIHYKVELLCKENITSKNC